MVRQAHHERNRWFKEKYGKAMKILGIDTSGYVNAVGLADGGKIIADAVYPARTDTLEQIVDNIDVVLHKAGMTLKDVGGIGVGLGPGSWTGIKVGVTVGKMLAFAAGKPVAGIPTLEALAYAVKEQAPVIYAVIGAGIKDTVYAARYKVVEDVVVLVDEYFAGDIRDYASYIKDNGILVGGEAKHYLDLLAEKDKSLKQKLKAVEALPGGGAVACLAGIRLAGGKGDDALALTPLYLKESTAKAFVSKYGQKPS
jgi:tRNA threonylcarbamoyladenosine biosynthesis protein TsaB